jgi:hypothetical protein
MQNVDENVRLDLRALLYEEDGVWVAHCLELDVPAEGDSPPLAVKNLVDLISFQVQAAIEDSNLASIFSPAPPEIWRLYTLAKDSANPTENISRPVHRLDVRALSGTLING